MESCMVIARPDRNVSTKTTPSLSRSLHLIHGQRDRMRQDTPDPLELMRQTAISVINSHTREGAGRCRECGETFPCARAQQADLALAGF